MDQSPDYAVLPWRRGKAQATSSRSQIPEARRAAEEAGQHDFADVAEDVVADLVGEDDFDFVGRENRLGGYRQQDAARGAEAGEHGVGLDGLVAQVHAVDALDRQSGALGPAGDAVGQARGRRVFRCGKTAAESARARDGPAQC